MTNKILAVTVLSSAVLLLAGCSPKPVADSNTASETTANQSGHDDLYLNKTDPTKGEYLADPAGKALYIFDSDTPGTSTCVDSCVTVWPPYSLRGNAPGTLPENLNIIIRPDGMMQYAWKGMPLYNYSGDTQAGDTNGDGVDGVWHLAK